MDGRNVRREHREADDGPREGVAGEKVVAALAARRALATKQPGGEAEADDGEEVDNNDSPVERVMPAFMGAISSCVGVSSKPAEDRRRF